MEHTVKQHELKGGAKLLSIQVPNAISVYFGTYVRAGYRFCDPSIYDVPHLLEHMSFEGNKRFDSPLAFKMAIERLGAGFNASTGKDGVEYYFVSVPENLEEIADIAISQLYEPLIEDEMVVQEKRVITQELTRHLDNDARNRGYRNARLINPRINLPYDQRIKNLQDITAQDVRDYFNRTYTTANSFFIVAGDLSDARVKELIDQLNRRLDVYPKGELLEYKPLEFRRPLGLIEAYPSHVPSQAHFFLSFVREGYDIEHLPGLAMLRAVYAGGLGSRMVVKSRQKGLTYSFASGVSGGFDRSSLVLADQTSPDKLHELFALAISELAELKRVEVSDAEIERAQGVAALSFKRSFQSPAALADWYIDDFVFGLPMESPQQRVERMLAVDRAAMRRAAARYLGSDNWVVTLIGPQLEAERDKYAAVLRQHFS